MRRELKDHSGSRQSKCLGRSNASRRVNVPFSEKHVAERTRRHESVSKRSSNKAYRERFRVRETVR